MSGRLLTFPRLYPGESLYSIISRYHSIIGHRIYITTTRELFENPFDLRLLFALPYKVNHFYKWLPASIGITPDVVTRNHTAWNYASLAYNFDGGVLEKLNSVKHRKGRGKRKALMKCLLTEEITLKYCSVCASDEVKKYGEPYWHVLHLLKGILLCPLHKTFLRKITLNSSTLNRYLTAEEIISAEGETQNEEYEEMTDPQFADAHQRLAYTVLMVLNMNDIQKTSVIQYLKKAEKTTSSELLKMIHNFSGDSFFRSIWSSDELEERTRQISLLGVKAMEPLEIAILLSQNKVLQLN